MLRISRQDNACLIAHDRLDGGEDFRLRKGGETELLEGIVGVGDEFTEEDVAVGVETVDDDLAQAGDVALRVTLNYELQNVMYTREGVPDSRICVRRQPRRECWPRGR